MQLTDLPDTLFLEVLSYLSAADAVVCRRLCRDARRALMRSDLSVSLILLHFPRSREGRRLRHRLQSREQAFSETAGDHWPGIFARLARRYFHLGNARPWRTAKAALLRDPRRLRPVTPWNRLLRLDDKTAPFDRWDPVWTCAPEEGLLVYPADGGAEPSYRARDLGTGAELEVPFELQGKVVRRVRLCEGILVFEWCEEEAFHPLNEREAAHRHFATAFDVTRTTEPHGHHSTIHDRLVGPDAPWTITFRCEWKIHYLGLPLSHHDRFFSTHNRTHYAVYIWQPNRSPWGEDDPLERLIVWGLGDPSPYRPSRDPSGRDEPRSGGPRVVRRLTNDQLAAWGVRQRDTPSLRGLALDRVTRDPRDGGSACGHVFLSEEEHRWSAGPHSDPDPPRLHRVRTTGIPLVGDGPRWVDDCGGGNGEGGVDAVGGMSFCWRGPRRRRRRGGGLVGDVSGEEEEEAWPGRAPCWRHDDFPYLTVSEAFDAVAGVRFSARRCFMLETLSVHIRPRLRVQGVEAARAKSKGRSWSPGQEGCDERAMAASTTEGRSICDREPPPGDDAQAAATRAEGPDGEEVQFADEMWDELLGKGFICGDERWLVGEDTEGRVTVLHF